MIERRASSEPRGWDAKLRAPFAVIGIRADACAVTEVAYLSAEERAQAPTNPLAAQAIDELKHYIDDADFEFAVPLAPRGTAFQQRVWKAICAVPRGQSRTYGEIARSLVSVPRPVGQACGANPIALIIPCHRVVGSRGALGGFMHRNAGAALDVKRWLLKHEGYRFGA